jgi:prepilin-type N-terminal cleavage/methylation domain-containing protein
MKSVRRSSSQTAFTLTEILVVVTIIGLLAGLSFPLVGAAQRKAWMAADVQKMRSIGVAMAMYASENDGRIPNQNLKIKGTDGGTGDRWTWHEAVDRYFDGKSHSAYNPSSIYNYQKRVKSPFYSPASKAYPEFAPPSGWVQPGPLWVSYNNQVGNQTHWDGYLTRIPDRSKIVVAAEICHNENDMDPSAQPVFEERVKTKYRITRPGKSALYLFADFRVDVLQGDRSLNYYQSHPEEPNIWRWW